MLCDFTKHLAALSLEEFFKQALILDRIDLETPQTVFVISCKVCQSTHSVEFPAVSANPQPPRPSSNYKQVA